MKTLVPLWLLALLCFSCAPTPEARISEADSLLNVEQAAVAPGTDLYRMGITHRVLSVRDTWYDAVIKFDVVHKEDKLWSTLTTFNDMGYITNIYKYDDDGDLDLRDIYRYDETGKLSRVSQFYGDGELRTRTAYNYNKEGLLTFTTRRDEDGDFEARMIYQFNEDGRVSQMSELDEDGELVTRCTYRYDKTGNLISQNEYDDDGDLDESKTWFYTFDDSGDWTSCIEYVDGDPYRVVLRSRKLPEPPKPDKPEA